MVFTHGFSYVCAIAGRGKEGLPRKTTRKELISVLLI